MIHIGDCLEILRTLPRQSAQCCVTSPPYFGLRDYGLPPTHWPAIEYVPMAGLPPVQVPEMVCCLGLESDPLAFIGHLVHVFRALRPVLADDGVLWLNLGDSYSTDSKWGGATGGKAAAGLHGIGGGGRTKTASGLPDKNLLGIPWRAAFALQADGWYLRQDVIWHKPNPLPEPVKDRCTKAHEYLFLLAKSKRYCFDSDALAEASVEPRGPGNVAPNRKLPGERMSGENANIRGSLHKIGPRSTRNKRSVWTVATRPFPEAHFATFPPELIRPCILAGSKPGDMIIDPFGGAGTTALVAEQEGRDCVACELNPEYADIAERRLSGVQRRLIA